MVVTSLARSSILGPPPPRGATGVCTGANTHLLPCKPAVSPSAELRFHPVSSSTSICPCNSSFRNSQGVSSRVAEVVTSALRWHRASVAWEVVPWNEKLSLGRWDGQAAAECLCLGAFKWSRRRRASHLGTCRSFLESNSEMRCIGNLKDGRSPSALGTKQRSPYLKYSRLDRLRCNSAGSDDENDTGKSTATVTEEQDEPQSTPPQPSSSDLPENSPLPEPKNLQLDAFRLMELLGPEKVDAADVALLKEKVFGYTTFWVTGQEPFGAVGEGVLLLGNLRGKREEVFAKLQRQLREVTGTKYNLFMVEEPNSEGPDPRGGPRVSFVLLRKEISEPQSTTLWQYVIAFVLFVLTAGSCLELGLASQLAKLPPDVVRYFTNPEVVEPPDLQLLVPYVESALPLAYGVLGVQLFHEVGHLLAASPKKVKLGIPYFIPNITLGSFGAITQFKSILPDRTTKFDVSLAGPLAGGLLSFAMLGVGLLLSTTPEAVDDLIQVPSMIFQGSLLLGLISRAALGYDAMHAANVAIHPLVIAGWCGLTTTAFNLLPVGCLDGGRAMQAAFGKTMLNIFSLFAYLLLGLGVLGGPLSLPWGLYILICQRSPEKPCLNDVSEVGPLRQGAFVFSVMLVVLTLLPLWNNLAEELGIGLGSPLL